MSVVYILLHGGNWMGLVPVARWQILRGEGIPRLEFVSIWRECFGNHEGRAAEDLGFLWDFARRERIGRHLNDRVIGILRGVAEVICVPLVDPVIHTRIRTRPVNRAPDGLVVPDVHADWWKCGIGSGRSCPAYRSAEQQSGRSASQYELVNMLHLPTPM